MARYGQAFKDRAVARLLPPESAPLEQVALELGVGAGTLERWRAEALAAPAQQRSWTAAARLEAVIATAAMDEVARSAWCRERGVYPSELQRWREAATAALAEPEEARATPQKTREDQRRIKTLPWSARSSARTRHWPRRLPCWCCQKNSRRSSTRARTNDPFGRSPPYR